MADALFHAMIDAVGAAADHAMTLWADGAPAVRRWEKQHGEPVCEADLAVDRMLRDSLGRIDPTAGWLSEESADDPARRHKNRLWVVDPIDGTRDFLAGKSGWSVSAALVEQGQPRFAVLAAPARRELWTAQAGQGASRNGAMLSVGVRRELAGARIPSEGQVPFDVPLTFVDRPNSIALRMAMVAADEADLIATLRWGNEWDIAAATLIAREAGADVSDARGGALLFNQPRPVAFGILCCAPGIYTQALNTLSDRARMLAGKDAGPA